MKKGTVLMVDDNLDMLLIGQRIFTKAGFDYVSARSGLEGLAKLGTTDVDIIILDYMLPDLNGLQFLRSMTSEQEYAAFREIPIIILTARTDYLEELDHYYSVNLRGVLTKPFGHRELVNVVDNALRLEKSIQAIRSAAPAVPAAEAQIPGAHWADDVRMAATTIARLTAELKNTLPESLSDEQRLDLDAIMTSSRRLVRMVDEHFPELDVLQTTSMRA